MLTVKLLVEVHNVQKIIRIFTTLIFSFIPLLLLAEQIETQISADTITVERGEILFAEGNVLVQYGNNKI